MISIKSNFIFVHIPKTAGNSIQNILRDFSEDRILSEAAHQDGIERFEVESYQIGTSKHATLSQYKDRLPSGFYDNSYKFTCIRNPWDRMISFYFSPHRGVVDWNRGDFLSFIETVPSMLSYLQVNNGDLNAIPSEFEYIIRFENLKSDFEEVCHNIGILKKNLPIRNVAKKQYYTHYYDQELIDKVSSLFAEEISLFNYQFNVH